MTGSITIRRARLALPDRVVTGDVVVEDGVIAQIGPSIARSVGEVVDADGRWLLPGAVDVLAALPLGDADAVRAATAGALSRGVTSMLLDDRAAPVRHAADVAARIDQLAGTSSVHFGVYAHADPTDPPAAGALDDIAGVRLSLGWRDAASAWTADALDALFTAGTRPVVVDGSWPPTRAARATLYAGASDPAEHARIHAPQGVVDAWAHLVPQARKHGRPLHLARVGSAAALAWLREHGGSGVTASVASAHLFLKASAVARMGVRAVEDPPLGADADQAALWDALRDGTLALIASGHTTVPAAAKDVAYPRTPGGLPTATAWLPLLVDKTVRGELSLTHLVRWTASRPAARAGLPRRGRLEVGFDADLALVDPDGDLSLAPPGVGGLDWSPFAGFTLRGRPSMTILRGVVAWRDGAPAADPCGRALHFARPA